MAYQFDVMVIHASDIGRSGNPPLKLEPTGEVGALFAALRLRSSAFDVREIKVPIRTFADFYAASHAVPIGNSQTKDLVLHPSGLFVPQLDHAIVWPGIESLCSQFVFGSQQEEVLWKSARYCIFPEYDDHYPPLFDMKKEALEYKIIPKGISKHNGVLVPWSQVDAVFQVEDGMKLVLEVNLQDSRKEAVIHLATPASFQNDLDRHFHSVEKFWIQAHNLWLATHLHKMECSHFLEWIRSIIDANSPEELFVKLGTQMDFPDSESLLKRPITGEGAAFSVGRVRLGGYW